MNRIKAFSYWNTSFPMPEVVTAWQMGRLFSSYKRALTRQGWAACGMGSLIDNNI